MARKDKVVTPSVTQKLQELGYSVSDWDDSKTESKLTSEVIDTLSTLSKSKTGKHGFPDRIYCNKLKRLLIIVEEKPKMSDHEKEDIKSGTISGLHWYMQGFLKEEFSTWKILGIAVSGDLSKEFGFRFDAFMIEKNKKIVHIPEVTNFMTEEQFLSIFENFNKEKTISEVAVVSKKINTLLRSIDSQKRPILLSALMISLYETEKKYNSFPEIYMHMTGEEILDNLSPTVSKVLTEEGISQEKINIIQNELVVFKNNLTLKNSNVLKEILNILKETIIPLIRNNFSTKSNYDVMGKFYEEFLRYAGVSNVKKGIVLTPRHITALFNKLIPLKSDDIIVDLCCGTGAFLISGMNALIEQIEKSSRNDKVEAIQKVKENQLLGFEINPTMYILAISNMLFRGDGKSSIYNYDSINDSEVDKILKKVKPTIGFINPPYSGKETEKNPTPKEVTFLSKMLESVSRYGIIIAPLSMYYGDSEVRTNILKKHTLKYIINMPKELFNPNAMTQTAIAVFETNMPHDFNEDVLFYNLEDDGFILTKNKGRTDMYNKWDDIELDLLNFFKKPSNPDGIKTIKTPIKKDDEWTIYAHSKTDYSNLTYSYFIDTVTEYLIYIAKKESGYFNEDNSDFKLVQLLINYYDIDILTQDINTIEQQTVNTTNWEIFNINDVFERIENTKGETTYDLSPGEEVPYIGAKKNDNGFIENVARLGNEKYISKGNGIVFINLGDGSGGYSTYQPKEFIGMKGKTSVGYSKKLNLYNALFIVTMLDQERYRYSFGRNWSGERFKKSEVFLPSKNGKPDWDYMEDFIKKLPFSELIND